jgi:trehalose-phosphatase
MDYDGTIAPFQTDDGRSTTYPEISELLHCIITSCRTRLIVVSGRSAQEIVPLLAMYPLPEIWGTFGIEKIRPDGRYEEAHVNEDALHILAQAEARLDREGLGQQIEFKLAGVALHWRGLPPAEGAKVRMKAYEVLQPLAAHPDVVLSEFDCGIELRLLSASKADALGSLLSELDFRIPIAYLGTDETDEEPFRMLNGRGLSVLVGPKRRFTADQWLKPPHDLFRFLLHWVEACGGVQ